MKGTNGDWRLLSHVRSRWLRYLVFGGILIAGIIMCLVGGEGERLFEVGAGIVSGAIVALAVFAIDAAAEQRHKEWHSDRDAG
jgi:hypothetical protein